MPCTIETVEFPNAFCDLGASINLMPWSLHQKLGLGEPKHIGVSLQLADRTFWYPRGIVEDVLVKVERFVFPIDFLILDIEKDIKIPILLGRSFLHTASTLIDFYDGTLTMWFFNEKVTFNVINALKCTEDIESCNFLDMINDIVDIEREVVDDEYSYLASEDEFSYNDGIDTVITETASALFTRYKEDWVVF